MGTSLKRILSNPVVIAILVVSIGIISYFKIGQSTLIKQMQKGEYLESGTFIRTLVGLTEYLGEYISTNGAIRDERYDNLKNLQYYAEGEHGYHYNEVITTEKKEKYLESGLDFYSQLDKMKKNSDFYIHAIIKNREVTDIECLLSDERTSIACKEKYIQAIEYSNFPYLNRKVEVYFFIPKGQILEDDYLASQLLLYGGEVQKFLFLASQMASILIYIALIAIVTILVDYKDWGANITSKIPIEIKTLLCFSVYQIEQEVFYFLEDIGNGNISESLLKGSKSFTVGYVLIQVFIFILLGYGIRDLIYKIQDGFIESVKSNSLLYGHKIGQKLYSSLSIDLRYVNGIKLILLNIGHTILLLVLVYVTGYNELKGVLWGIGWCIFVVSLGKALSKDWGQMLESIMPLITDKKIEDKIEKLKIYKSYIKGSAVCYSVLIGGMFWASIQNVDMGGVLALCYGLIVGLISWKIVNDCYEVYLYSRQILETKDGGKSNVSFLSPIVEALSQVERDFNDAVQKEVTSQRMKTELISNVSHDLKTPLTTIISYVDLLKRENLTDEDREKYIGILDKQSQRLKILIEDLFEASKAASGNIEFAKEEIDLVSLLQQTLGEMGEKIEASGLQFKVSVPEQKVVCRLDGRRTYRIFENLIGNILKYAAPYSRVYIECAKAVQEVVITFKNMSAQEMNFTAEEIIERFKRGDESRHTEGSGLGLAIAKNLTELQGGKFEIYIDGDLFKATLKFSIIDEEDIDLKEYYNQYNKSKDEKVILDTVN